MPDPARDPGHAPVQQRLGGRFTADQAGEPVPVHAAVDLQLTGRARTGQLSLAFPTRWATGALGSATDLPHAAVVHPDAMWTHDLTHLAVPIGLLFAASGLICAIAPSC